MTRAIYKPSQLVTRKQCHSSISCIHKILDFLLINWLLWSLLSSALLFVHFHCDPTLAQLAILIGFLLKLGSVGWAFTPNGEQIQDKAEFSNQVFASLNQLRAILAN